MDAKVETLIPARQLAAEGPIRIPGESAAYRKARTALLAEEIELRRHLERVAAQRRALPPGAPVTAQYLFQGEDGATTTFEGLFGDKQTLCAYTAMYGPKREKPCPMCTNFVAAWESNAVDLDQKVSLVVIAGAPIERLISWKRGRDWSHIRLYTDLNGAYLKDWFGLMPDGGEVPAFNVFTRRDGTIRHFWTGEITTSDPGQDPRGAPDMAPLWNTLDATPEGRGGDWYPKLDYD